MNESFSPQQQLKAFINAAQYLVGMTSGQDIWEEAGKFLVRFFGADIAVFGERCSDGGIEIGHRAFSERGRGAWFPEPEMNAAMGEVFESGFLTFMSYPAIEPIAVGFFPILHENRVLAVMLVGHLSAHPLAKETLDLYLAAAGLIGTTYSRRISETAVLKAKEELEQRVVERTTELSAANASLRDSRSAALKMMEDAVVARRQAEEANAGLRLSEARFRTLFETMTEGFSLNEIICNDRGKPCDFRYLQVNPTFERHTGLKVADIVGRTVRELFPDTEPVWIEQYGKVALTGEPVHFEGWFGPLGRCFEVNAYQTEPGRFAVVFFDVTERKQAEEALRESEERLRLLGDNLPESAVYQYVHEPDGSVRFLYFSAGMERLNGVSVEEVLADAGTLHRQIAPEYLERLVEAEARSAQELSDFNMEMPMLLPDGQVRWMQLHSRPRRLPDGRVIWDGVQTDVTNRKKAEELLLESEGRFRRLVNQAPIPLCFVNKDGVLVYSNDRFVQTFGYTHEDVPTLKEWWLLAYPEENYRHWVLATWEEAVERAAKEDTDIQPIEYNVTCKNGTVRVVEISGITIEDNFLATFSDLTERKRTEAALRESEVKYRNLFTNMTEEVHFWKLVNDESGQIKTWRVVDVNPPTLKSWGRKSLEETIGKTADEIYPGATAHYMPVVQKIMREGIPYSFEDYFPPPVDKYYRFTSVPFGDHFITTGADITSIKKAELALQKAHDELAIQVEERTRELREKEVLLKEVHHRVKNNLQVISSLVGLQADGSTDETVREVLRDVTYRVRSMALVHEKLYQSADLGQIDFADYAQSLLSYLWRAHGAAAANVRMTLDLSTVLLPVDTAVPCGLILNELAGNALKHAFRGRSEGEVTISLQSLAEGRVRLGVHDDGVGLPDGFDWRQPPSLGLRLVQMLSGQLDADVEVSGEEGTRFEITIEI
jgi:PAS domain S-box-containing protein